MRPPIRFGLFMSQAGRTWDEVVDGFRLAEDLGFDHGWLVDHLVDTDHGPGVPVLEAWTLLAALAAPVRPPGTDGSPDGPKVVGGNGPLAGPYDLSPCDWMGTSLVR